MKHNAIKLSPELGDAFAEPLAIPVAELVAQVYETAPPEFRITLLEQLLKPLGVLSLMGIADGIFAKIRFSSGWPSMTIRVEDANKVQLKDIVALVGRLQQGSIDSLDGIAKLISATPNLGGAAAAALALTVLVQHERARRSGDQSD